MRNAGIAWALAAGAMTLAATLSSPAAHAARLAKTKSDTPLFSEADAGSQVLATIPAGSSVATSTNPTNGFYRAKGRGTPLGWVQAGNLEFQRPAAGGPAASARARAAARGAATRDRIRVRALGSMNLFNISEVNEYLGVDTLKAGLGVGLEGIYMVSPRVGVVLRLERIMKSTLIVNSAGTQNFDMSIASMPIMGGLEYELLPRKAADVDGGFSLSFSVLGGMGLNTTLTSVFKEATAAGNATVYGGSGATFMGKLNANMYVARSTAIFAEAGYRMLKGPKGPPTTAGQGADLFKVNAGADYEQFTVDLSGPVIGVGLTIGF